MQSASPPKCDLPTLPTPAVPRASPPFSREPTSRALPDGWFGAFLVMSLRMRQVHDHRKARPTPVPHLHRIRQCQPISRRHSVGEGSSRRRPGGTERSVGVSGAHDARRSGAARQPARGDSAPGGPRRRHRRRPGRGRPAGKRRRRRAVAGGGHRDRPPRVGCRPGRERDVVAFGDGDRRRPARHVLGVDDHGPLAGTHRHGARVPAPVRRIGQVGRPERRAGRARKYGSP